MPDENQGDNNLSPNETEVNTGNSNDETTKTHLKPLITPPSTDRSEADEIKKSPEELLKENIETARKAIVALVEFAIAHGVDPEKLSFIGDTFDESAFSILPDYMFNQAYKDLRGLTDEQASNIGAITDRSHGTVFMKESTTGKTHYVIHEAMHRADFLGRLANGTPKIELQLASDYFLNVGEDGKLEISDELKEIFEGEPIPDMVSFVRQIAKDAGEGFTEWTARKGEELATQKGTMLPVDEKDHAYPKHVEVVDIILDKIVKNLGCSPERAQAMIIETAFTGDLTTLREGLVNNFREIMEHFVDHPRGNGAVHIDY